MVTAAVDLELLTERTLALTIALSERHRDTSIHSDRVVGLALELGAKRQLPEPELQMLSIAAALHDIGKIGILDQVLLKPGKLSDEEWETMKTHSEKGQHIVLGLDSPRAEMLAWIVRHHHERYDGSGYPDGLAGDSIPLLTRIISIADSYDAMAADRVYRRGRTHAEIMSALAEASGIQHSPALFAEFADVIDGSPYKARLV